MKIVNVQIYSTMAIVDVLNMANRGWCASYTRLISATLRDEEYPATCETETISTI